MTPTVAIVAQGSMGAAVAKRLISHDVKVLTSLAGRGEASAKRARDAGMQAVDDRELAQADIFMSIVPPGEALGLAKRLAPVLAAANNKSLYVECNAISPPTMLKIAEAIAPTGCEFVGAGIIGPPPRPGSTNTKIYTSGPFAQKIATLNDYGLVVRVLDGPLTAASALKMSYAGITKGYTALGAAMMLASTRGGSAAALKAELAESQPDLMRFLERMVPGMYGKAYRWVAEMNEISNFVGEEFAESEMLSAASRFYERMAADEAGRKEEIALVDKFLGRGAKA
jgi:3-hydroxyisobutyrate dehydrogenase-like beta-hydroxyacid dehydrogenase